MWPNPAMASVEIFLDESDKDGVDISTTVNRLKTLVSPEPSSVSSQKPSAPHVLFEWGEAIRFKGYVDSVAVKYTMFRGQGTPIRGTVTVAMKEFTQPTDEKHPNDDRPNGNDTNR